MKCEVMIFFRDYHEHNFVKSLNATLLVFIKKMEVLKTLGL